jgi:hypothetical protein
VLPSTLSTAYQAEGIWVEKHALKESNPHLADLEAAVLPLHQGRKITRLRALKILQHIS